MELCKNCEHEIFLPNISFIKNEYHHFNEGNIEKECRWKKELLRLITLEKCDCVKPEPSSNRGQSDSDGK